MTKITKLFIFLVLLPLVLGIFGEELFNSASNLLIPVFLAISIAGSVWVIVANKSKKLVWYLTGSAFIVIDLVLLFLLVSFKPGF